MDTKQQLLIIATIAFIFACSYGVFAISTSVGITPFGITFNSSMSDSNDTIDTAIESYVEDAVLDSQVYTDLEGNLSYNAPSFTSNISGLIEEYIDEKNYSHDFDVVYASSELNYTISASDNLDDFAYELGSDEISDLDSGNIEGSNYDLETSYDEIETSSSSYEDIYEYENNEDESGINSDYDYDDQLEIEDQGEDYFNDHKCYPSDLIYANKMSYYNTLPVGIPGDEKEDEEPGVQTDEHAGDDYSSENENYEENENFYSSDRDYSSDETLSEGSDYEDSGDYEEPEYSEDSNLQETDSESDSGDYEEPEYSEDSNLQETDSESDSGDYENENHDDCENDYNYQNYENLPVAIAW